MKATRRRFLKGAAATAASPAAARARRRPNVLLLISDQWAAAASDLSGRNRMPATPAADSIAAAGMRFENAYCTYPLCSPSRVSLFTGRMPHETGIVYNVDRDEYPIPPSVPTLTGIFAANGYDTAYFGKEHTGGVASREAREFGSIRFPHPGHWTDGAVLDPLITRDAVRFLGARRERPYFAVVSWINPHDICYQWPGAGMPVRGMADLLRVFDPRQPRYLRGQEMPPVRANAGAAVPGALRPRNPVPDHPMTEAEQRRFLATYYLLIENTDWMMSQVLEAARRAAPEEDTIILFTSDHGEQMGAHGIYGKGVFYEEAMRVPLAVSWKGTIRPGQVNRGALVSGVDVLPTLCDLAGLAVPRGLAGRSLRPLVAGGAPPWRESLVAEMTDGRMLRTATHKYIRKQSGGEAHEFLFDLREDPLETRDAAAGAAGRQALERHRALLDGWMEATGGALQTTMSQFDEWRARQTRK